MFREQIQFASKKTSAPVSVLDREMKNKSLVETILLGTLAPVKTIMF
jgi:hypothetical protein